MRCALRAFSFPSKNIRRQSYLKVRCSVSGDGTEPHGTTHRAIRRGIMSAKAGSGISVMRADLDASTSTEVDAHEAQWRAGVNRQARPDAASQRRAASLAALEWLLQPSGGG